jgi:hypothetical protein
MIQKAFGNKAMGCTQVKEWFRQFKKGRKSAKSDERSGSPSTSRNQLVIDKVCFAMLDNRRIIIRELSDKVGLPFASIQSILTEDLGMKHISAKFVPKLLTLQQEEIHLAVATDLLQCVDQDANFMRTIITGDESCVYRYSMKTKAQPLQWKTPGSLRPKKTHQVQSKVEVILTLFLNHEGIIQHQYAPDGQTANKEYHIKVLH